MKKIMFNDKYGLTQAVLEGRKTQTRRIITYPKTFKGKDVCGLYVYRWKADGVITEICMYDRDEISIDEGQILPKYKIGEIIAIAQSYNSFYNDECNPNLFPNGAGWTNKMYVKPELMPHQIRITNVRAERLQDISDEDCLKEGIIKGKVGSEDTHFMDAYYIPTLKKDPFCTPQGAYSYLIDKISGKGTWENNPYVFVYDFELIK
nr:MAG TPA: ASCH domain protein [Crassvirales sp.]